jgi:formyltetrahydrofolate-dependent phosphoribosylglycinamide formyltransferase
MMEVAKPSSITPLPGDTPKCRLGVLLSGRGSNFAALCRAIEEGVLTHGIVSVVISNRSDAPGLDLARARNLPAVALNPGQSADRAMRDASIATILREYRVDLVVLAGYDRIIGPTLLEAYPGRILNIHPSLLPAYGGRGMLGLKVHTAVLAGGEMESGCTAHLVTEVVDGGAILEQSRVPVLEADTPETLAARVLEQEHRLYPRVIQAFIQRHFFEVNR